jgi:hypothetical protein
MYGSCAKRMYAASEAGVDGGKVGGDIELGVVAAPSFISVHLGSEVEEERFAERLGAGCARVDDRVRAARWQIISRRRSLKRLPSAVATNQDAGLALSGTLQGCRHWPLAPLATHLGSGRSQKCTVMPAESTSMPER